jgi:hypothetical protein
VKRESNAAVGGSIDEMPAMLGMTHTVSFPPDQAVANFWDLYGDETVECRFC